MGMIKIYQGKSKPANKKPGWKKQQAEYEAWLASVNSQTLFNPAAKPKMKATSKKIDPVVNGPVISQDRLKKGHSLQTFGGAATKPVARPDILYKGDPEMLARELKARERRFATAPAYNKGNAVLITDEMMKDITAGKTRRR